MKNGNQRVFLVWKKYQRRVESLASKFETRIIYYHFPWEEKSKGHKAVSYTLKFSKTLFDLFKLKPKCVFLQLPPPPVLYASAFYCLITGAKYILDCHNDMLYGSWHKWPFAIQIMKNAKAILVHNEDVIVESNKIGLKTMVMRDPIPIINFDRNANKKSILVKLKLENKKYVIVPGAMAIDEPLEEIFGAARQFPEIKFAFTWFSEKLPKRLKSHVPENALLTGFLEPKDFNVLFANASAALVLTTWEGTQQSGAAEAIAFEVPLILSDFCTTRSLFGDVGVFVYNYTTSITKGLEKVLYKQSEHKSKMRRYKKDFEKQINGQVLKITKML